MSQKKYWKSIEELENTAAYQQQADNEFQEELPVLGLGDKLLNAETPRRDFLKYLGFTTLAATVAASCEMPVRKAIPYAIRPDADLGTPGVANYYASSFVDNGDYCAVVVKTRDGRPIMIEGNTMSAVTKGGVTARVVAATLSLYDTARLRGPMVSGKAVDIFDKVDAPIAQALAAGGQAVLLTGSIISPSTKEVINKFLAKYPGAKHIQYDAVSHSGMLLANEASFGKRALPSYHFDNAQVIFSIGCDFLGSWLSPAEFSADYAGNRKVSVKNPVMSKHYQVEGMMSTTGMSADERATCRPSEYGKVAAALYAAVTSGTAPGFQSKKLNALISAAAADLKKGKGLVVCGSNDVNIQTIVNAINSAIGAYGSTINWGVTANYRQGIDADMVALTEGMNAGQISTLLVHGVNPVYDYFDGKKFAEGLKKVKTTVSFNDRMDETTEMCTYAVPDHHWLESWGDAEPKTGYYSFIQPTIVPLFKTRAFQDSLLKWAGDSQSYHDFWQQYWVGKLGSQSNLDKSLQDGVAQPGSVTVATNANSGDSSTARTAPVVTGVAMSGASFGGNVSDAISKTATASNGKYEVVVYPSVSIGHGGSWSNNPWLQEVPDPVTRATWDNYLMMSPNTAKNDFDAELDGINQVETHKRVVKVKVGNNEVALPIVVIPGMHDAVVAVAMGYGRSKNVGRAAADLGKNVFPLVTFNGSTFNYTNAASLEKTADKYQVAIVQTHMSSEGRPIIHEYTLEEFKKNPNDLIKERNEEIGHYTELPWEHHEGEENATDVNVEGFRKNGTLYPVHEKYGIHWGMSIDLSTCTGCAACVVACQSENNISVVGKSEVLRSQEMSWLRIDRYFSGDPKDPDSIQAVLQPMLCQHCDNAPCENVCPVSATNHSSEGLNQMAYNRCIGTKYCANNCPYKVRRFNWFDWNGADSFKDNLYADGRRDGMNDDLTRMVLNPDVTVRSRGVMEKCSFCVQRLQEAKLHAKKEGRPLQDGEAKTACQVACASDCITFGNVADKNSAIYKIREENKERVFYVLEQIHTLPNVNYLSKIRNASESVTADPVKDEMMNEHI